MYVLRNMPTNNYEMLMENLENRIRKAEMSEANRELLKKFKRDLEVRDYSDGRIYKLLNYLKLTAEHVGYDFEEATEENIKDTVAWYNKRDVADATKRDTKIILKMFYKWLNGGEYPEKVKWINTTRKRSNSTLPKDALTEKDIRELMDAAKNSKDRALIALLWETGARIGELIDLEIGDLEDHDHGKKVVIQGKTGARRIPLISSVPHIQAWLNNHPRVEKRRAPLWVNIGTRNTGEKMEYRSINKSLKQIGERAGIDKPVNPHHFRHSRATYLASRFTESQLCEWFGWVQGFDRPADYVHMSGRDIDVDYDRLHGIEHEEEAEESELAG